MTRTPLTLAGGLRAAWRLITAFPRALWGLFRAAVARRHALTALAQEDPALAKAVDRITSTHEPLIVRYQLRDAQGKVLEVVGMPGHAALYRTFAKAALHRRKGERVERILVPESKLKPTLQRIRKGIVSAIVIAAGAAGACTTLTTAPPLPEATLCTGFQVETLWIDGVPLIEELHTCPGPDAEVPTDGR